SWHAIPLVGLAAVLWTDAAGQGLLLAAMTFSLTSLVTIPLIRFGIPLAAFAAHSLLRARQARTEIVLPDGSPAISPLLEGDGQPRSPSDHRRDRRQDGREAHAFHDHGDRG